MYSIFLDVTRDVWRSQGLRIPDGGRAVNLKDAVETVRCDGNAARKRNRQRYVVTKLAAGAILLRRHNDAAANRYEKALDDLGVNRVLVERLSNSPATTLFDLEGDAGKIIDSEDKLCDFQRSCCTCITECKAGASGGIASVAFSLRVPREPKDTFCVVDPQTWPTVSPGYFKKVYVIDSPACTTNPQCRTTMGPCPPGSPPSTIQKPPPAGSAWCGLVDEQFETQVANTTAKLENLLRIRMDFTPDDASAPGDQTATRMRYGLCEAFSYEVGGTSKPCGLELDCGESSIEASGAQSGGTRFSGIKSVRFQDDLPENPNGWAPIALEVLVDESAVASCIASCGGAEIAPPTDPCDPATLKCKCPSADTCQQITLPYTPPPTDYCP